MKNMNKKIVRAEIVLVAHTHNLSMITEDWIKDKNLINEKPIQTANLPGMANFISQSYQIVATDQKIVFATNRDHNDNINVLQKLVYDYVEGNKYLNYVALGYNFITIVQAENEELPKFTLLTDKKESISDIFKDGEVSFGGIVYVSKNNHKIRINIDRNIGSLELKFNYHFDLAGKNNREVLTILNEFHDSYEDSKRIVSCILNKKGGESV